MSGPELAYNRGQNDLAHCTFCNEFPAAWLDVIETDIALVSWCNSVKVVDHSAAIDGSAAADGIVVEAAGVEGRDFVACSSIRLMDGSFSHKNGMVVAVAPYCDFF